MQLFPQIPASIFEFFEKLRSLFKIRWTALFSQTFALFRGAVPPSVRYAPKVVLVGESAAIVGPDSPRICISVLVGRKCFQPGVQLKVTVYPYLPPVPKANIVRVTVVWCAEWIQSVGEGSYPSWQNCRVPYGFKRLECSTALALLNQIGNLSW